MWTMYYFELSWIWMCFESDCAIDTAYITAQHISMINSITALFLEKNIFVIKNWYLRIIDMGCTTLCNSLQQKVKTVSILCLVFQTLLWGNTIRVRRLMIFMAIKLYWNKFAWIFMLNIMFIKAFFSRNLCLEIR